MSENGFESKLKVFNPILAIAAFVWGVYTYRDTSLQQAAQLEAEAKRNAEIRRVEATRPFLDKQLLLYTEVTQITATIATSTDSKEIEKARGRFENLFYGELALVERDDVAIAMVKFKGAFDGKEGKSELKVASLKLAHACRDELATSWGTDAWKR